MVESAHDVTFLSTDSLLGDLFVGDLLVNQGEFEGVNLLVLASHEHGTHSNLMQVSGLKDLLGVLKVAVHVVHSKEERLVLALVRAQYLNHPVDHLTTEVGRNRVSVKTVSHFERDLIKIG